MPANPILAFILRQHTPLIHFQHDQAGATLRATELKPKLDRFIIEQHFHNKFSECRNFLVGYSKTNESSLLHSFSAGRHRALDYKLRISLLESFPASVIRTVEEIERLRPGQGNRVRRSTYHSFFANMNVPDQKRKKFTIHKKVKLTFSVFNEELRSILSNSFPVFISKENFGNRQSKGFGSFYLDPGDPAYAPISHPYSFTIDISHFRLEEGYSDKEYYKIKELFRRLDLFYRSLRSGIHLGRTENHQFITTFYMKSLLFQYFREKGIKWDKRIIKEQLMADTEQLARQKRERSSTESFDRYPYQDEKLVRDLLGLATEQEWHTYGDDKVTKTFVPDEGDERQIERFKSPITFKPMRLDDNTFRVFVLLRELPEQMFDANFMLESSRQKKSYHLRTPYKNQFSLADYFDWLFKADSKVDFMRYMSDPNNNIAKTLVDFYKQIRSNIKCL